MPIRHIVSILLWLASSWFAQGQRADGQYWPCNPLVNATCPPNPGLSQSTYSIDFTNLPAKPDNWTLSNDNTVKYGPNGAEFTFAKRYDAPQLWTDFYILFGRVDVLMRCAPGQGIISSSVLISDDFDEIDWEWSGNDFGFGSSKGMVQNNYFGKGITGTYDRGLFVNISSPQTLWHTYSVDWTPTQLQWLIDGVVVRTFLASSADHGTHQYPQSPSKLQLGLWDGGDASENGGTVAWAGGYTDVSKAPFTMYVKSVKITNNNPAYAYNYTDHSGTWQSINKIQNRNWNSVSSSGAVKPTSVASSPILKPTGGTTIDSSAAAAATSVSGSGTSVSSAHAYSTGSAVGSSISAPVAGSAAAGSASGGTKPLSKSASSDTCTGSIAASTADGKLTTNSMIASTYGSSAKLTTGSASASSSSSVSSSNSKPTASSASAAASTTGGRPTTNLASTTSQTASVSRLPPSSASAAASSALHSVTSAATCTSARPTASSTAGNQLCENIGGNNWYNLLNRIPFLGGIFQNSDILCNVDYPGSDITSFQSPDFNTCINSCKTYKGSATCDACAYLPDSNRCYLKNFDKGMPRATVQRYTTYCALGQSYTSKAGRWRKRSPHLRRHAKAGNYHRRAR